MVSRVSGIIDFVQMKVAGSAATVVTFTNGSSFKYSMPVVASHSSRVAITGGANTVSTMATRLPVTKTTITTGQWPSSTFIVCRTAMEASSSTMSHLAGTGSLLLGDQAEGSNHMVGDSLLGTPMVLGEITHHPGWLSILEIIGLWFGTLDTQRKQELTGSRQQISIPVITSQVAGDFLPGMLMVQKEMELRHVLLCTLGTIG